MKVERRGKGVGDEKKNRKEVHTNENLQDI